MTADPDNVVVELAVKLFTFKFNEPDPEIASVPATFTEFVLVKVMALVIETVFNEIATPPARFCALVVNEISPEPDMLKLAPLLVIPPLNS